MNARAVPRPNSVHTIASTVKLATNVHAMQDSRSAAGIVIFVKISTSAWIVHAARFVRIQLVAIIARAPMGMR